MVSSIETFHCIVGWLHDIIYTFGCMAYIYICTNNIYKITSKYVLVYIPSINAYSTSPLMERSLERRKYIYHSNVVLGSMLHTIYLHLLFTSLIHFQSVHLLVFPLADFLAHSSQTLSLASILSSTTILAHFVCFFSSVNSTATCPL